jgi:hypothetical protein
MTLTTQIKFQGRKGKQQPETWKGQTRQGNHYEIQYWTHNGAVRSKKKEGMTLGFTLHGENVNNEKLEIRTEA